MRPLTAATTGVPSRAQMSLPRWPSQVPRRKKSELERAASQVQTLSSPLLGLAW